MKTLAVFLLVFFVHFKGIEAKCGCQYDYKAVGCYNDRRGNEALPELLQSERDKTSKYYNGHDIDWMDWDNYMPQQVCRCAEIAFQKGYKYFGIEYWGECWSGPSPAADWEYSKHGTGAACYGKGYHFCKKNDVNCVGASSHIFVYEIATYACDVHFEKIGCFNDYSHNNDLALTARDKYSNRFMGKEIDWLNYDIFLPKFACECAKKAIDKDYDTFGLQYYGECWVGEFLDQKKYRQQGETNNCVNKCYENCQRWDRFCMGKGFANTIYRITHPNCEMKYESLGCYNMADADNNLALPELMFNEVSPAMPKFNGYMLKFDDEWDTLYSQLLCRCARAAEEKGYTKLGITKKGECWSGLTEGNSYAKFGESQSCYRGKDEKCEDKTMCAGSEHTIMVYTLHGREIRIGK